MLGVLLVAAPVLLGGCGGECAQSASGCGHATFNCPYDVYIYAKVPEVTDTWTVTACLDAVCESVQLLPPGDAGANSSFLGVEIEAGTRDLMVVLWASKADEGKAWSLSVTDAQGRSIVGGTGTVHHQQNPGGCPDSQQVKLP